MKNNQKQGNKSFKILLVIPSLVAGGMERVMVELSDYFSQKKNVQIDLCCLIKTEVFFDVPKNVKLIEPLKQFSNYPRAISLIYTFFYLRRTILKNKPDSLLSFGGKYNSFVLLASSKLRVTRFISDRSRPDISYGRWLDFLNPIMYKRADGIIAQTSFAKRYLQDKVHHNNIRIIGNPVRITNNQSISHRRKKQIINVGRFIKSKQQKLLLEFFIKINNPEWQLIFIGDGPEMERVRDIANDSHMESNIYFTGNINNVESYLNESMIFAFTSISEGFPNALAEAMSRGLACISFDCNSGPSDLISNGQNGYLIDESDQDLYISRLNELMDNPTLCKQFGEMAIQTIKRFELSNIGDQYLSFITNQN